MELQIFNNGRFYLEMLLDVENKMYFRAEDLCIISGFDVVNVIEKECLFLNHKDEIFINEDGFYSLFQQFPVDFRCWYDSHIIPSLFM